MDVVEPEIRHGQGREQRLGQPVQAEPIAAHAGEVTGEKEAARVGENVGCGEIEHDLPAQRRRQGGIEALELGGENPADMHVHRQRPGLAEIGRLGQ